MTVIGEDDLVFLAVVVVEGDVEFVGESVDDRSADAEASEGARAGHESDFREVGPGFTVFGEFVADESVEVFGEVATRFPAVGFVVEFEDGGGGASVEVEFHWAGSCLIFTSWEPSSLWLNSRM